MSELAAISIIVVFAATILLSSRFFYRLALVSFTKKVMRKLGLNLLDLSYSFDQMVYFVSLPSNIPHIKNAKQDNIIIKYDYTSMYMPKLKGIKVYIQKDEDRMQLAYLAIKNFRLPKLDQLLKQGEIDETTYLKISIVKLIHEETLQEIQEEVFKQIRVGRKII